MQGAFQQLADEKQNKGLVFYGFNPRMIPDTQVVCKPVYRKLMPRAPEELALIQALEAKKARKRKSRSAQQSKVKINDDVNGEVHDTVSLKEQKRPKKKKGKKTDVLDLQSIPSVDAQDEEIQCINNMLSELPRQSKEPDIEEIKLPEIKKPSAEKKLAIIDDLDVKFNSLIDIDLELAADKDFSE